MTAGKNSLTMADESAKRAAQEYLAAKLSEEGQRYEDKVNLEAAIALGPRVWKRLSDTVLAHCRDWNAVTGEQSLTCKETALGDLRIRCAGREYYQMYVHYDPKTRLVTIKNTARPENDPDTILRIAGYASDEGRDAHLVRNNEPVNLDRLILGHLRVLAGLSRRAE
jgi:hypothetical protein